MAGVVHACGGYAGCGVPRMQRLRRERPHLGRAVCSLRCLAARASGPLASPSSLLALLPRVVCSMRASSPSPTLTPTDPVPRGLLTLWAGLHIYTHAQGKHTHAHTHTHTHTLSLSLSLSRARARSLSLTCARAHTHTLSPCPSSCPSPSLAHTRTKEGLDGSKVKALLQNTHVVLSAVKDLHAHRLAVAALHLCVRVCVCVFVCPPSPTLTPTDPVPRPRLH